MEGEEPEFSVLGSEGFEHLDLPTHGRLGRSIGHIAVHNTDDPRAYYLMAIPISSRTKRRPAVSVTIILSES